MCVVGISVGGGERGADDAGVGAEFGQLKLNVGVKFGPEMFAEGDPHRGKINSACTPESAADHDKLRVERIDELGDGRTDGAAASFDDLTGVVVAVNCACDHFAC